MILTKENNIAIIAQSLLLALFCDAKCVNAVLSSGNSEGGVLVYIYLFTISLIFILSFLCNRKSFHVNKEFTFIIGLIIVYYMITTAFIGAPRVSLVNLGVYTIAAFLIPFIIKINVKVFILGLMIFPLPAITKVNDIFIMTSIWHDSISMGLSYAFLTPVIASIIYLGLFFKNETRMMKIISIPMIVINGTFASYLVIYGSRGPVLAIIATIIYLLAVTFDYQSNRIQFHPKRTFILTIVGLMTLYLLVPLLTQFNVYLDQHSISLNFVDKILAMNDNGDISNGRNDVYSIAISGILDSPIWGNGFDRFYINSHNPDCPYPHNFILQMLYDGGILMFSIILFPIIKRVRLWYHYADSDEFILLSLLLFSSVPRCMFSGDLWESSTLWVLFGFILSINYNIKKEIWN